MHGKGQNPRDILSCCPNDAKFFKGFIVEHIERVKNTEAEELAKAATKKNDRRPLCKNN
jgi:hypothetical protein